MATSSGKEFLMTSLACLPDQLNGQFEAHKVSVDDFRLVCFFVLKVFEEFAECTDELTSTEQDKLSFLHCVLATATQYLNDFPSELPLGRTVIAERQKISVLANRLADVNVWAKVLSDSMGEALDQMQRNLSQLQREVDDIQYRLLHIADE